MKGWVKVSRQITEWKWFRKPNVLSVWIWILAHVQHQDYQYGDTIIHKGEVIVGRKQLAEECGLSEQMVRTAIKSLKSTNEITTEATNKYTRIKVVNWDKWNGSGGDSTNNTTDSKPNEQPTNNQQITTKQEYKNDKNVKNIIYDSSCNPVLDVERLNELMERRKEKWS